MASRVVALAGFPQLCFHWGEAVSIPGEMNGSFVPESPCRVPGPFQKPPVSYATTPLSSSLPPNLSASLCLPLTPSFTTPLAFPLPPYSLSSYLYSPLFLSSLSHPSILYTVSIHPPQTPFHTILLSLPLFRLSPPLPAGREHTGMSWRLEAWIHIWRMMGVKLGPRSRTSTMES